MRYVEVITIPYDVHSEIGVGYGFTDENEQRDVFPPQQSVCVMYGNDKGLYSNAACRVLSTLATHVHCGRHRWCPDASSTLCTPWPYAWKGFAPYTAFCLRSPIQSSFPTKILEFFADSTVSEVRKRKVSVFQAISTYRMT